MEQVVGRVEGLILGVGAGLAPTVGGYNLTPSFQTG